MSPVDRLMPARKAETVEKLLVTDLDRRGGKERYGAGGTY